MWYTRLTLPFAISPAIVELSTAVYVTPPITAVSPTVALGHSHVPFTKEIEPVDDVVELALTVISPCNSMRTTSRCVL